jgi:hypothetical protein
MKGETIMKQNNFVVEVNSKNGYPELKYDFQFHIIEAIKYQNWWDQNVKNDYVLTDCIYKSDFSGFIPVGSVEFVLDFYKQYHGIENIKPINIPEDLHWYKFLKRFVVVGNKNEWSKWIENYENKEYFVKSIDKIKGMTDVFKYCDIPEGKLLMSELIDIDSEWRCFVHKNKLVGMQNYSGDFTLLPDINFVRHMINSYKNSPMAYTLDVGVNKQDGTFLIEAHQFFSCGLYGFADYRVLLDMVVDTHSEILKINGGK